MKKKILVRGKIEIEKQNMVAYAEVLINHGYKKQEAK